MLEVVHKAQSEAEQCAYAYFISGFWFSDSCLAAKPGHVRDRDLQC
jgi:hypothetical protein